MAIDFNPTILGKPLFPSSQRTGDFLRGVGQSVAQAFTPAAGTPPATMAGVTIPPAGASFSQLQYKGPLLGTGPMFGILGAQQPAPQPAQPSFDYGTYAATRGFPSFDVTKIQTPFSQYSASAPQQLTASLAQSLPPLPTQLPTRVSAPEAITPNQATPAAGFARISDWSQSPLVQAARATGDVSALARATEQARNQGRSALAPKDITGVSLADLKELRPEAGFGTSRTPEQQQAMLAQMRFQGADTMRKNIAENQRIIDERRANLQTYTTPSGNRITAPTNMFGQPIASWQKTYEAAGKANEAALARMGRGVQPATSAQPAAGPSFGVRGVGGVTMPFESSALSGGPQPSTGFGSGSITRPSQYSNSRAEQRKRIRQLADAYGIPRPFSRGVENQYRQEFSRMGLLG
jgi:hypothetical protein